MKKGRVEGSLWIAFLVACAFLFVAPGFACEESTPCAKCAKDSEFSWNPHNQFVSPRLQRFYELENLISEAYKSKKHDEAKVLIAEYLGLAKIYRCNWNYGNAIHESNRVLGLILLDAGDIDGAASALIEAGKSRGSPQLGSFGPELDLANELLQRGRAREVAAYLGDIKRFWKVDSGAVDKWLEEIDRGDKPELDRLASQKPGAIHLAAFFAAMAVPLLISLVALWAKFRQINRKAAFVISSLLLGYTGLYLSGRLAVVICAWLTVKYLMHWLAIIALVTNFLISLGIAMALLKVFATRNNEAK
jgi:hypothetical protein